MYRSKLSNRNSYKSFCYGLNKSIINLVLATIVAVAGFANAQDDYNLAVTGDYKMPGFPGGRSFASDTGTEIIDPFSGLLKLVYTDMSIPGNGGLDINIQRYYNSVQEPRTTEGTALRGRSVVGIGWDMHFGRIYPHLNNRYSASNNPSNCKIGNVSSKWNPVLELADGTRKHLVNDDSNDYSFTTSDNWKASCLPTSLDKGRGGLIVYSPNGLTYIFADFGNVIGTLSGTLVFQRNDFAYLLTKVLDAHGNYIEYTYENVYPLTWESEKRHAVVTQIHRNDGKNVNFEYSNIDNKYALLTDITTNGANVNYEHVKVDTEDSEDALESVRFEDNSSWKYTYYKRDEIDSALSSAPGWKSIKKITNPTGATTTYTYDAVDFDPDVNGDTSVVVKKQVGGKADTSGTWHYEYTPGSDYDETRIKSNKDCTVYQHRGHLSMPYPVNGIVNDLWRKGTLIRLERRSPSCSYTRQQEIYDWGGLHVSTQNEIRALPFTVSENTRKAVLLKKTVIRDNTSYTIENSNFDAYGNPQTIVEKQGSNQRTITRTYTLPSGVWMPHLVKTEKISGISGDIEYDYFSHGKLRKEDRYGLETEYTYHSSGALKTITDPNDNVTQFLNYYRGTARTEIHADTTEVTRTVDTRGNITSESLDGITTTYHYDEMDRILSIITPREDDNNVTFDYDYNSHGFLKTVTRGPFIQESQYDGLGLLIKQTAKGVEDITVTADFDALGRMTFTSFPNELVGTRFEYDDLGRLEKQTNRDNTIIRYDYRSDNKVRITDEKLNVTVKSYLAYGDGEPWLIGISQPEGVTTTINRLNNGLIDYVSQNGVVMDYGYNGHWQLVSQTRPETGTTFYGRDNNGNMTTKQVGSSAATIFNYDVLNRIDYIDYPDSSADVDYIYDPRGNLNQLVKGNLTWDYQYDDNNNLSTEKLSYSGQEFEITRYYNSNDVMSGLSYPNGEAIAFNPDAYGRIKTVGPYINDVSYYPNGQINTTTMGNGVVTTLGQSQRLWPTQIQVENSAVDLVDRDYSYDNAGNVESITNYLDATATINLGYDGLHRLTSASGVWGGGSIGYDELGNIDYKNIGPQALTYHYDATTRRLNTISGSKPYAFDYDIYGNVISNGYDTFSYNDASNMVAVPGLGINYEYDGYNRRAVELKDGVVEKINLYDAGGQLLFEHNAIDKKDKTYFYLGAHLAASKTVCSSLDSDDDGLSDCFEMQMSLNPFDPSDGNVSEDLDNDGISNEKEISLGMDPNDPSDGLADNDGDGYSNRQEFWLGTNPNKGSDKPRAKLPFEPDFLGYQAWDIGLPTGSITKSALSPDGSLIVGVTDTTEPGNVKIALTKMGPGGNVDWMKNGINGFSQAPVIAEDGTIYIVDGTNLRAMDSDGTQKWLVNNINSTSRPALANDGTIYIGGKFYETRSNGYTSLVDGLLALDPNTGLQQWAYNTGKLVKNTVVDAKGAIYVVGKDDLISLNPDGTLKSKYFYYGSPAIGADGTLYISEENFVFAVDGETGVEKWRYELPTASWDFTSPVLASDGTVYAARINGDLYAIDHQNGNLLWQVPFNQNGYPQGIKYEPAVAANGRIYVVTNSYLYLLNTDGSVRWAHNVGQIITAPPTVDVDSTVYITAGTGLYAVVDNSGGLAKSPWPSVYGNSAGSSNQCRNAAGHHEVLIDSDSDLIADCEEVVRGFDPQVAFDYPTDLDGDGLSNSDELAWGTDRFRQDTDADGLDDNYEINQGMNPLDHSEGLLDSDGDGFSNQQELVSKTNPLEPTSTPVIGEEDQLRRIIRRGILGVAEGINGDIYTVSQAHAYPFYELMAYTHNGKYKWRVPLAGPVYKGISVGSEGTLYIPSNNGITAISPDGEQLWVYDQGYRMNGPPAIGSDGTLYANSTYGRLHAISPEGNKLWEVYTGTRYLSPVIDQTGNIYTVGYSKISAHTSEGAQLWSKQATLTDGTGVPNTSNALSIGADGTLYTVGSGSASYLLAINSVNGNTLWQFQSPKKTVKFSTPVIGPDGTIYFAAAPDTVGSDIYAVNPDGTQKWIFDSPSYVRIPPRVGADGSIYFGYNSYYGNGVTTFVVLNPDGEMRWSQALKSASAHNHTLMSKDGLLYFLTGSGNSKKHASSMMHRFATNIGGNGDSPWPVLGGNNQRINRQGSPAIAIASPSSGTVFAHSEPLNLSVQVNDRLDGDLSASVNWQSDIDGDLGLGTGFSVSLSEGVHQVTATVTNSLGKTVTVPTMVTSNQRPTINITAPSDNDSFLEGSTITFTATAQDGEDGDISTQITWTSDIDGDLGSDNSIAVILSPGNHVITAKIIDSAGLEATEQINVDVTAAAAVIYSPALNTELNSAEV